MKKFAKIIAGLWLVGVLVMGIGGTWLSHGGDEALYAAATGQSVEELEARREKARADREAKREASKFRGDGWGDETVPMQKDGGGWAE